MFSPKGGHQQHLYAIYLTTFVLLYNLGFMYQDQMLKMVGTLFKELSSVIFLTISSNSSMPTHRALQL